VISDERTTFARNVALNTGAPGAYVIGDAIDTGIDADAGGSDLYLVIAVRETAASSGAATLAIRLMSASTASLNPATATAHGESPTLALAALVAGRAIWTTPLPRGAYRRWIQLVQVTGGAAFTGGKVSAFLTDTPSAWRALADASN